MTSPKSTTADRIAGQKRDEALWVLEDWLFDFVKGKGNLKKGHQLLDALGKAVAKKNSS